MNVWTESRRTDASLHAVHRDVEDENRLVFLEHWAHVGALRAHFAMAASGAFVREAAALAVEAPELSTYEAQPIAI